MRLEFKMRLGHCFLQVPSNARHRGAIKVSVNVAAGFSNNFLKNFQNYEF